MPGLEHGPLTYHLLSGQVAMPSRNSTATSTTATSMYFQYLIVNRTMSHLAKSDNAANALPLLALSLFGGAIADRMERKRIVQLGQAAASLYRRPAYRIIGILGG